MSPLLYLLVILGCILLSAFFSSSETALLRLRPEDVDTDVSEAHGPGAVAARNLLKSTSKLLVTILLGNNVVNILGASCASGLAVHYFGAKVGIIVSTVVMTITILIFSEVLPKAVAARRPKKVSYAVALPLYLIHHALFPVHILFERIIDPIVKRISGGGDESMDSSEEVLRLARRVRQRGPDNSPVSIIAGAADAADMTVEEIMVARTEIVAYPAEISAEELLDEMIEEKHTRVPIYKEDLDRILGVIHIKDLMQHVRQKRHGIADIIKPVLRVPERKPILPLLGDMQHSFAHMAIVKDEFGVTRGLVTQEDILEEIVGEIRDEFDKDELEEIKKISDETYEGLGRISVLDFNRETDWEIEAEKGDTLSGLTYNLLGRPPKVKDTVYIGEYQLRVAGVSGNRITRVRVTKTDSKNVSEDGSDSKVGQTNGK